MAGGMTTDLDINLVLAKTQCPVERKAPRLLGYFFFCRYPRTPAFSGEAIFAEFFTGQLKTPALGRGKGIGSPYWKYHFSQVYHGLRKSKLVFLNDKTPFFGGFCKKNATFF